jgi:hypothetical protein
MVVLPRSMATYSTPGRIFGVVSEAGVEIG